jgi:hypothetical protein
MLMLAARLATEIVTEATVFVVRWTAKSLIYGVGAVYKSYRGQKRPIEPPLQEQVRQLQYELADLRHMQTDPHSRIAENTACVSLRASV